MVRGGGSRIRTHVPDLREAVFKTAALSHSAIPPSFISYELLVLQSNLFKSYLSLRTPNSKLIT